MDIVDDILKLGATLFAYAEINIDSYRDSDSILLQYFKKKILDHPNVLVDTIESIEDVLSTLETFLKHSTRKAYDQ